jgi:hypothetical protein
MYGQGLKIQWITCALIFFGALVACSTTPTPLAVVTSTLIPSTATFTTTPFTPSPTAPASATLVSIATVTSENLIAIFESNVTPDANLTTQIFDDLANELGLNRNRIQLVLVEVDKWSRRTLGCDILSTVPISVIADDPDREVNGFRYVLLVGNTLYEYHTEGAERFLPCPELQQATGELLITIDPIAEDILRLVQGRVANELDLSTRHVQLVDIRAVTWPDTSLGCPKSEQNYTKVGIEGYRIVVSAGETEYIFHSDFTNIYPCTAELEILPEENELPRSKRYCWRSVLRAILSGNGYSR